MKYLFAYWNSIRRRIAGKYVVLLLDYDGTLTPIVETPDRARISKQIKQLLKALSMNPRCTLAIISGRCLKDIKKKVGLRSIIYSGNHGLEIQGPDIRFEAPVAPGYKTILQKIKSELKQILFPVKGILLEDKGLCLSLHYRLTDKKEVPFVRETFYQVVLPYLRLGKIKTETGKKVLEVRPAVEWSKGKAVLWLLSKRKSRLRGRPILPIYIGDDITDEDAFKALKNKGLTIFVGKPKRSHAKYYLKNTRDVSRFLIRLNAILIPRKFKIFLDRI
jgi:trehalose-phosphatase